VVAGSRVGALGQDGEDQAHEPEVAELEDRQEDGE
jgi:hypothetical protein